MGRGNASQALLLVLGAGLLFLSLWVLQDFGALVPWLTVTLEGFGGRLIQSILRLLISVGLFPASFGLGLILIVVGLRPDLFDHLRAGLRDYRRRIGRSGSDRPEPGAGQAGSYGQGPWWQRLAAWLGVTPRQLAFLGMAPLFAGAAFLAAGDQDPMRQPVAAISAWMIGMVLALAGGWRPGRSLVFPDKARIIDLVALSVLAFLIRAWSLDLYPIVLTGDEGSSGLSALRFLSGETDNIFNLGWFSFPNLFFYIQSRSILVFGRTVLALRLPSALVGALTVGGTYLFGRAIFNRRTALLGAGFLAVLPVHNHFSRLGLNNVWDGLAYVLVLGLLWHGWRTGERRVFLLGGLALGVAQYFYITSRLLILLIPLWALVAGARDRQRLRAAGPNLAMLMWTSLAAAMPLGWFYARHPDEFLAPLRRVSALAQGPGPEAGLDWLARLGLGLGAYTHVPPASPFYLPGTPLLGILPATLFIIGILALFFRQDSPAPGARALLLLWLLAFGLIGAASDYTPAAQRYVAVGPALVLAVAWGLETVLTWLARVWRQHLRWLAAGTVALALVAAAGDLWFYFVDYSPYSALGGSNTLVAQHLADTLVEIPPGWQVVFFGGDRMEYDSIRSLPYLAPHVQGLSLQAPWGSSDNPVPQADRLLFIFLPGLEAELVAVQADFPQGSLAREWDFEGNLLYTHYQVPAIPNP